MTKEKQQPKFCVKQEVREYDGNSLSPTYEVLKVFWWESKFPFVCPSCYKYILVNTKDPEVVLTKREPDIKSSDDLCPYEVYGNMMVGKTIKSVDFSSDNLIIVFEDDSVSKFSADCCQNHGYLEFEGR